ncbi:hypothetical protein AMTRI_Chr11g150560 [Amborella trichopoda]|uniref:histidine-containing phosphotransfer protein 2 n=1 Tax=Amborella trichopoda TaxID=13333 RepID=UPI0005D347FD|nr:histidine-containing phosphotransfer protein 2 [Amborella trichopoda]|eukprot:XP_011625967.1 histidine-containing phosphotransfer protein 2 [Amborella trichopoda]
MAIEALKQQLTGLLEQMYREGCLDEQFHQLQLLQDESNPGFVAEVISLFCDDSEKILTELTRILAQDVVEFNNITAFVHQLKGSSSSIGAHKVKLACNKFRTCCENTNKEGCQEALDLVKQDFYTLRTKFQNFVQLEQKIQALENGQM